VTTTAMDKAEKTSYQSKLEKYIENKQIYDFFETLLRKLLIVRPDDPYEYLIKHLSKKKQTFVVSFLNISDDDLGLTADIAAKFNLKILSKDHLLDQEVTAKTPEGEKIKAAKDRQQPVDNVTINAVFAKNIESAFANDTFGLLLDGYPGNINQALFLQRSGVIPDRFFVFTKQPDAYGAPSTLPVNEKILDGKEVMQAFRGFYRLVDIFGKSKEKLFDEVTSILGYRIKDKAPLRPPRIILSGLQGMQTSKIAQTIADRFGLVNISAGQILRREVEQKTPLGEIISEYLNRGEFVPDDLICGLVYNQLCKSESRVFGWILDGFPLNKKQLAKFANWDLNPHFVVVLKPPVAPYMEKTMSLDVPTDELGLYANLFIKKARDDVDFLQKYFDDFIAFSSDLKKQYPMKVETLELEDVNDQTPFILKKVAAMIHNPNYYS